MQANLKDNLQTVARFYFKSKQEQPRLGSLYPCETSENQS